MHLQNHSMSYKRLSLYQGRQIKNVFVKDLRMFKYVVSFCKRIFNYSL
ncbi:unnamed protein product [Brassica rapa subsp. trilocularis]